MNNDWQKLQSLFHTALSLGIGYRTDYLARECADNEPLRQEVESLLAASEKHPEIMEQPVLSLGMQVLSSDPPNELLTGQLIGSFTVHNRLGAGGMGEVYLAEDTQLGRPVALKFLSSKLADNPWAKRQFVKEAQSVARLDHPNICTVHRFEETDGHSFIVMQYVEGETLDHFVQGKKLRLNEILCLSVQIASALAEAHAHGIIHRDVKPPNIMVTAGTQIKVLDFGLAKLVQKQKLVRSGEISSHSQQLGLIPGTVAYMSPEQLRGERLDYATDIFSFGTVLYQMVSGRNPFARDNEAETISAILTSEPPSLRQNAPQIPREFERIMRKCLEKERAERYQFVNDLLFDLETLQKELERKKRTPLLQYLNVRVAAALVLLLLLAVTATFIYNYLSRTHSVAVLPIVNNTGDADLDYLSDGITDNTITKLSGLSNLRVKPYTTVSGYKVRINDLQKIQELGHDLNVDVILVGELTGSKSSLTLQTAMISTADGSQLSWKNYNVGIENLFLVEEQLSSRVVNRLELWSRRDETRLLAAHQPPPPAHEEYLLGRYYWRLRDEPNLMTAIEHFNMAKKIDPLYAQAWAGLAESYVLLNTVAYGHMDTREAMNNAEAAAKEALEIDNTLPEAHTALGNIYLKHYGDWQDAEKEFKQAIELNPDYAPAHYGYSNLLTILGRHQEAIAESVKSRDLDPFSPPATLNYCRRLYYAREYGLAGVCFNKLVEKHPDFLQGKYALGLFDLQQGRNDQAIEMLENLYERNKALAGAALGYAYGVTGRTGNAKRVLSEMQNLPGDMHLPWQEIGIIYLGLGERDNAFLYLKKAADEHFAPFAYLNVDPLLDGLHSDPRFVALVQRLNLPKPQPSP